MVERTGRPGYLQIADDLRKQISDGRLAPGQSLPSTAQLSDQYEVSAGVVKAAISVLRTEGAVIGQQGKGVFVRDQAERRPPSQAASSPAGDEATMRQLTEVLAAVRDLGERVARIERSVFPEPPQAGRPGK
ncbi:winged helix-turn-helix domain-containing protein [Actinomadura chibensis]|uniref:Winged helix-turn-helix transcriptional regulator n=1 Tax=Actinomadura chibensis TaxID=392828 RepID=A0A5D0NYD4_9ACTN|nr:winged helix-turn-helix domain-containing protein [Actinomadura chibensis]TYB49517.1 winged helix-turn-helix transcriptional regulator [Actinomadura chibensis]